MRSIGIFLSTASLSLAAVLGLNLYFDPFGLVRVPVEDVLRENPRDCAIDKSLLPEGAQKGLKTWLLAKTSARSIAIGSSRVQKIRRADFAGGSFVSFSLSGLAVDSYPGLGRLLAGYPKLSSVVLGLEFYAFGDQTGGARALDRALEVATRLGLRAPALELAFFLYELRGSPHFTNAGRRVWDVFNEYLSRSATERSLAMLGERLRGGAATRSLELPPASQVPTRCYLTAGAEVKRSAWDPRDASDYSGSDLLGQAPAKSDDSFKEYEPSYFNGGVREGNHWDLLVGFRRLSEFKLAVLERLLERLEAQGVRVVGFTPPFPEHVMAGFERIGARPLWDEFNRRATELFARHGHQYVAVASARQLGCDDYRDFDDPWHPSRECTRRALRDLRARARMEDLGAL